MSASQAESCGFESHRPLQIPYNTLLNASDGPIVVNVKSVDRIIYSSSIALTWNGKPAPSRFLHKQLDVTRVEILFDIFKRKNILAPFSWELKLCSTRLLPHIKFSSGYFKAPNPRACLTDTKHVVNDRPFIRSRNMFRGPLHSSTLARDPSLAHKRTILICLP